MEPKGGGRIVEILEEFAELDLVICLGPGGFVGNDVSLVGLGDAAKGRRLVRIRAECRHQFPVLGQGFE